MRNLHQRTILVVEDDENDQFLMLRALRNNGVTDPIHVVSSGSEAIAYLNGEGKFADRRRYQYPGFIITDLQMARGDGFSVLEYLKECPNRRVIPTVVLSDSHNPNDLERAYLLGASCYHRKPGNHEKLQLQLKMIHDYWMTCEVPQADSAGKLVGKQ